jgi:hypothetical protein
MPFTTQQPAFHVFLSSPGDVRAEREAAERVVRRIAGIYAAHVDIIGERWEGKFYQATASFQEQIEATSAFLEADWNGIAAGSFRPFGRHCVRGWNGTGARVSSGGISHARREASGLRLP